MVSATEATTEELVRRLEELRASRQRLVSAQDEERRRLERDLHDGAQQHLVALRVHLGLAGAAIDAGPEELRAALDKLQHLATEALQNLRDLAHGIYPPLLADEGLVVALRVHTRSAPLPVEVWGDALPRYAREAEMAVYFCCLEAVQNASKYSAASGIDIRLTDGDGALRFSIEDDGRGFDPAALTMGAGLQNMTDRVHALGGELSITSSPGAGTRIAGEIPTVTMPGPPSLTQASAASLSALVDYYAGLATDQLHRNGADRGPIDYYLEPAGRGVGGLGGEGRDTLELAGDVRPEQLEALFRALHPGHDAQLGRGFRAKSARAFDATFSAPKSVSVLWALSPDPFAGPRCWLLTFDPGRLTATVSSSPAGSSGPPRTADCPSGRPAGCH
ncbi:hypothetical protein BH20ACT1_BH20ACT1_05170 [soil metagenome]